MEIFKNRPRCSTTFSFLLKIGFIFLLISMGQILHASECYHYHTSKTFKIVVNSKGIFHQITEKDPNGISYVQQVNRPLKGIDKQSFKIIGEDESTFMFSDKNGFYLMPKQEQYEDNTATYSKILSPITGQKHINGRLFFIKNKWVYFNGWKDKITKIILDGLPSDISNIKSYSSGMYIKSNSQVFSINIDLYNKKPNIKTIPNLNPVQVVYYACNPLENEDYIADEQHVFSIRNDGSFYDVTPQFRALNVQSKFNTLKLIDANVPMWRDGEKFLKKRDGHSLQGRDPFTGEEIDIEYSYTTASPLVPVFGNTGYFRFHNKIYPNWEEDFNQSYELKTDASKLEAIEGKLFKGGDFYYLEADNDFKIINTNISAKAQFFPGVYSYGKYLNKALVDEKYIYFIGDRFNIHLDNKKELTSKIVKQLGLFYLFNNAFYDGEKSYPIKATYETLSSLGSFVEVINSCAGDMPNTPQVTVKYHQFFKDENAVYYFDDKTKKLQVIQTADPNDFNADDYEALQTLYKIKDVKGAIKKKTDSDLNYYLIFGCTLVVLGLGFYVIKRKE